MARPVALLALTLGLGAGPGLAQQDAPQARPYVPTPAQEAAFAAARTRLERWTRSTLTRFATEAEIRRWLADADAARRAIPRDPEAGQEIMLIEPRAVSRGSADVTVPVPGVDQGDAVRQAGRFLLLLAGGSVLVVDTGNRPGAEPRLVDQAELAAPLSSLFDEILLDGDRVIVTGRAGQGGAVFIAAFRLGVDGRLTGDGTWLVSGEDDARVRIVGDQLVIYSSTDQGYWGASNADFGWPRIRRWDRAASVRDEAAWREEDRQGRNEGSRARWERVAGSGRPLLRAQDVYRPVGATFEGELHIVSVCPLASLSMRTGLACHSTGFAGSAAARFTVTADHVYLLTMQTGADRDLLDPFCRGSAGAQPQRAWLYRVPLAGGAPDVAALAGEPGFPDAVTERDGRVRLLLREARPDCAAAPGDALVTVPPEALGPRAIPVGRETYAAVEDVGGRESLFTETMVATFQQCEYGSDAEIVLVPIERPGTVRSVTLPHTSSRVEPVSGGVLVSGKDEAARLAITFIPPAPGAAPSTLALPNFSEVRNDGYVSVAPDGLIGLPLDRKTDERDADGWRLDSPDVQFLRIGVDGRLARAGVLVGDRAHGCGACSARLSRAIFMSGRIFALAGGELIEGRLTDGEVRELRRFDIAAAVRARRELGTSPAPSLW